jgi:uncharacterized damage-inducible protein DinB
MSESGRIWDLLQRAYAGNAWHGPALRELLAATSAEQAAARPVASARTIWETALHMSAYEDVVRRRLQGEHIEELPSCEGWPSVGETSPAAWRQALATLEDSHTRLRDAIWGFPEARLDDTVPGRDYPYYLMLYGVIQHELFHAGQIVVLQQALGMTPRG